jgi:hypothetical protein
MKSKEQKLKELTALQQVQNAEQLEGRVAQLENTVATLQSTVSSLTSTLSELQMAFHKDHTLIQQFEPLGGQSE